MNLPSMTWGSQQDIIKDELLPINCNTGAVIEIVKGP